MPMSRAMPRSSATSASMSSQIRNSQRSLYSGRNAKTESTISAASAGAEITLSRWSSPVSGSVAHSTTCPEPAGPAGPSSSSVAARKSYALR
jgi:hypothetical protein